MPIGLSELMRRYAEGTIVPVEEEKPMTEIVKPYAGDEYGKTAARQASLPASRWGSSVLVSTTIGMGEGAASGYRMRLTRGEARDLAELLIEAAKKSEGK